MQAGRELEWGYGANCVSTPVTVEARTGSASRTLACSGSDVLSALAPSGPLTGVTHWPPTCRSFSSRVLSHRSQRVVPCLSRAAGLSCQLFQNHCYACTHTCTHTHTHIPQSLGPWNQAQTPFPPASLPLPIEPSSFLITMDPSARFTQLLMCAVLSLPRLLAPRVK